jgi:hypothetical protein
MDAVTALLHRNDTSTRVNLAVARVVLTAHTHNLKLLERARRQANVKVRVEDCLALPAHGWANGPPSGVWHLEAASVTVAYSFDRARSTLQLAYQLADPAKQQPELVAYWVKLTAEPCRFGGLRWRFLCPLFVNGRACTYRADTLYLPPSARYFGCRHCYGLTYTSRQKRRHKPGERRAANTIEAHLAALRAALQTPKGRELLARLDAACASAGPTRSEAEKGGEPAGLTLASSPTRRCLASGDGA